MRTQLTQDYDTVLYPSYTHSQTHPDRLAVIASLYGMTPAPVDHCRVLELGCGDGNNLVPMAMSLKESDFLGIDLATRPIAKGREAIHGLGLKNIRLEQADLLQLADGFEPFDYIIAHGLYAWVPDQVKKKILSLCKSCLNPQGVAFISYNAYPGGHLIDMIRDMMLFHVRDLSDPQQRITQSIALLKFLIDSRTTPDSFSSFLNEELKRTLELEPALLYHDQLGAINTPLYFFQFMEHAAQFRLQFLGEADFFESQFHIYSPEAVALLQKMAAESTILKEQYLDFLKCRRFRQTLLCHAEVKLAGDPIHQRLSEMYIASRAKPVDDQIDFGTKLTAEFVGPRGGKIGTDYPLAKAALFELAVSYPKPIWFPELRSRARRLIGNSGDDGTGKDEQTLLEILLRIHGTGLLELYPRGPEYVTEVSQRPKASPLAQFQIEHDNLVTNLRHTEVEVKDEIGRQLLKLLDGTRDRQKLLEDLVTALNTFTSSSPENQSRPPVVAEDLEKNLKKLANLSLLIA
jgi:methyltransferase-like protein/2-polyprenyl-3-methyl-5-hydroxy-6-metoxy-1,4-benzoquinol methylase